MPELLLLPLTFNTPPLPGNTLEATVYALRSWCVLACAGVMEKRGHSVSHGNSLALRESR